MLDLLCVHKSRRYRPDEISAVVSPDGEDHKQRPTIFGFADGVKPRLVGSFGSIRQNHRITRQQHFDVGLADTVPTAFRPVPAIPLDTLDLTSHLTILSFVMTIARRGIANGR